MGKVATMPEGEGTVTRYSVKVYIHTKCGRKTCHMGKADTPYGDGVQAIQGKVDKPYRKGRLTIR